MVELQHGPAPLALTQFQARYPQAKPEDFDAHNFAPVKRAVRTSLHRDQNGLCVYCECTLQPTGGQVDHIKPKGGPNAHPHLSFVYQNYAYSCINNRTCGQKKNAGLLPIEPAPGCNVHLRLSTDGTIEPVAGLTKQRKHQVLQTCGMLGLNKDAGLIDDRKRWFSTALVIAQTAPAQLSAFLGVAPFRHIMATAF
jgi:uncharacterized protein (TIGR02646 family)